MTPWCEGKQVFATRGDALKIQRIRNTRNKRTHAPHKGDRATLEIYRCSNCNQWHVGSFYLK